MKNLLRGFVIEKLDVCRYGLVLQKSIDEIPFRIWIDESIDKGCDRSFTNSWRGSIIDKIIKSTKTRDNCVQLCKVVQKCKDKLRVKLNN